MCTLPRTPLALALRTGAILLPLALVAGLGFSAGRHLAVRDGQTRLAGLSAAHAREMQALADDRAAVLAAAMAEQQRLERLAREAGLALTETRARLADSQRALTRRINDATLHDGNRFTGLGPDGLRVYRAALGYPELDADLPATGTGHAGDAGPPTGASAGLPVDDLLAHAIDYGQWCRQLDARLNAIRHLFAGAAQDGEHDDRRKQ